MGRPSRPTHLKVLSGERESRINRGEPLPTETTIVPPKLSDGARQVWDELAGDLADKGCLSSWDVPLFAVWCEAVATHREVREAIGGEYLKKGSVRGASVVSPLWRVLRDSAEIMVRIGGRFGLTPADRASLDLEQMEPTPTLGPERLLS